MKSRWPKAVLLVLAISLLTVLLTTWLQPREPFYQGKPLSYWLRQLDGREDAIQQASAAFRVVGPQAMPFLLKEAKRERPFRTTTYCAAWLRSAKH